MNNGYKGNNNRHNDRFKKNNNSYENVKREPEIELKLYEDDGININRELVNQCEVIANKIKKEKNKDASSQLRQFFNKVVLLAEKEEAGVSFNRLEIELMMLKPLVHYRKSKVSDMFLAFIEKSIEQTKKAKKVKAFRLAFEALIGFIGPKKD